MWMNKHEGGGGNPQCSSGRAASVGTQWLALGTRSCSAVWDPVLSLLTGEVWAETAWPGAQGTTGQASKHRVWHRAAHLCRTERGENPQKGRSREAQAATREECQMHKGTNVATKHLGECEGKRCSCLSPQARCTCWVAPSASHMQDAYQDRSLPRSPLASTLPLFPTAKTYLVWVLRVLFLREGKKKGPYLFIPAIKSLQGWDLELPGKADAIGAQGREEFPGGGKEGSGVTKPICSCPSPC